jgi:hypothetical protein
MQFWGFPDGYPTVCDYAHFHGGSGVLVSIGAMRKASRWRRGEGAALHTAVCSGASRRGHAGVRR